MSTAIPQPPVRLLVGNLPQIDTAAPVQSLMALSRQYGPLYKLQVLNRVLHVASSQALINELCDETRFEKRIHPVLREIRAFGGDGLFTAASAEPNWARAHRILMPAFGPLGVRGMFGDMLDIADQMFTRWERFGPDFVIDVPDSMTRLTLDTIALCAFDTRFNSFYRDEMHPFVGAMVGGLAEAGDRTRRPALVSKLMRSTARRFDDDVSLMRRVAQELIDARRATPDSGTAGGGKDDLLDRMLNGRDPETGEGLSDENIGYQMITFLIAGHETTSGLLSFATYLLLKNPEAMLRARAQVDAVLGGRMPRIEDLAQMRYLEQILMETLRLWPTAPVFAVSPKEATTLGGQYPLTPDDTVMCLLPMLHRDTAVWGADPEAFRPDRFAAENAAKLPPNAWKPFGNGARACIGRPFAMQEAHLVLAMMLQRFDLALADPSYQLKVHETLTLKPEGLRIRARARRPGAGSSRLPAAVVQPRPQIPPVSPAPEGATPLLVLYGSNTGSAQAFAARIAAEAGAQGFAARLAPLDQHAQDLPTDGALVIVSASYEGQPPDNARRFVPAVESLTPGALDGLGFAVFGCGNRQWARTWQAIPRRIDTALANAGARRLVDRGEGDSGDDFFGAFDTWIAGLWPALAAANGKTNAAPVPAGIILDFVDTGRADALRLDDLALGTVIENRELADVSAPNARSKRHIELRLPQGMSYRAGDYLAVLPRNAEAQVDRVLRRFGLAADAQVVIRGTGANLSLPRGHPVSLAEILTHYTELAQPATRAQVAMLAGATRCPPEQQTLEALASDRYEGDVLARRVSALDLLERFPSCSLPFAHFLDMLPPLRARQYSISSSPMWKADHVTLTVAVVDAPALSGHGRFGGVASCFLAALRPGDRLHVAVRPSNARFHPPADPETPLLMVCAGSGIAPFRGFLQERALQKAAGRDVGPALLFLGTHHPAVDDLYRDELDTWQAQGVVEVHRAFSDRPDGEIRYVQHRLWAQRSWVIQMFRQGATIYVCGDGKHMAPAVRDTLLRIAQEELRMTQEEVRQWADRTEHDQGRYVADIFA